jgi:hypothetical protein
LNNQWNHKHKRPHDHSAESVLSACLQRAEAFHFASHIVMVSFSYRERQCYLGRWSRSHANCTLTQNSGLLISFIITVMWISHIQTPFPDTKS